jgi:hypothetical protein
MAIRTSAKKYSGNRWSSITQKTQPIDDTKEKKDSDTFSLLNITKEGLKELQLVS